MTRNGLTVIEVLVMVAVLAVLCLCIGSTFPGDLALNLTFGWVIFLGTVLPRTRVDVSGVVTGTVCLTLFVAGAHSSLRWLYGAIWPDGGDWKFRWTASMAALVVVAFAAGTATVGVAHQVGWLARSPEPILGSSMLGNMRRLQSVSNLKEIGLGLHNYHGVKGVLPPGGTFDALGRPLHGWHTLILPYTDYRGVADEIDLGLPWSDGRNATAFKKKVNGFLNPGQPFDSMVGGYAASHYSGNVHIVGGDVPRSFDEIVDGLSNTILAGEIPAGFKAWGDPTNWRDPADGINRSPRGFGGPYKGGANILMGDGSVVFIKETIDPAVFKALGTPNGREVPTPSPYLPD